MPIDGMDPPPILAPKSICNLSTAEVWCSRSTTLTISPRLTEQEVKTLLRDAMQGVLCSMASRFSRMEIKEEAVGIASPALDGEISNHFEHTHFIEPNFSPDQLNQQTLEKSMNLKKYPLLRFKVSLSGEEVFGFILLLLFPAPGPHVKE